MSPNTVLSPNTVYRSIVTALATLLLAAIAGCAPSSPEQEIAEIRSGYQVELNSWRALQPEPVEPALDETAEAAEGAAAAAADAAADVVDEEEIETGPQQVDVLFDLVVFFRGRKSLDGITVDVTQADASKAEKAVYRQYIEVAGMVNGETRQVDFVLEGLELEEGDGFAVELVPGVPADLSEYREFSG